MRPVLKHPTRVLISRLDRSQTAWDPDFRTTAALEYEPQQVRARAQVRYGRFERHVMVPAGESPETSGRLTMYREEFERLGGLRRGDRIDEIGGFPVEVYVTEVRPAAMQPSGEPALMIVEFESRRRGL